MNKAYVAIIGKVLIVLGIVLLFTIFPGSIILSLLIRDFDLYETIINGVLVAFFVVGFLVLIFMKVAGHTIKTKNDRGRRR